MIPNITLGAKEISAYMICTIVGMIVAGFFAVLQVTENERMKLITVLLWSAPGVVIGGSILYGITNINGIITSFEHGEGFLKVLSYFGGSVFYGGLLGGLCAAWIYCKIKNENVKQYTDAGALFIPLFHAFGRLGCFLSGCCFGVESEIGFVYRYSPVEMANGVRRFPVQLVEACGELVIFAILYFMFRKKLCSGKLLSLYFVMYPVLRFCTEFLRGDYYRGFLFGLSTSQNISIILFIVGAVALIKKRNTVSVSE